MTNAEAIRGNKSEAFKGFLNSISDKELASILGEVRCSDCFCKDFCKTQDGAADCHTVIFRWLNKEVEE